MASDSDATRVEGAEASQAGLFTSPFEGEILERLKARDTGALELLAGQARRAFFFRAGRIVGTSSNLKSETPERVAQRLGITEGEVLLDQIAITRLSNAFQAEDAQITWHPDRQASRDLTYDTSRLLMGALERWLGDALLSIRLGHLGPGNPVYAIEGRDRLELVPPEFRHWIEDLDGVRTVFEACEFGPAAPVVCRRVLYLAARLGLLHFQERGGQGIEARTLTSAGENETFLPFKVMSEAVENSGSDPDDVDLEDDRDLPAGARAILEIVRRVEAAQNAFDVLDVPWDKGVDEFRDAYFRLARQLHPDHLDTDDPELVKSATAAFDRIRDAWDMLKDDKERADYTERIIHGKKSEDELAMDKVREIFDAETIFRRGVSALNAGQLVKAHAAFEDAVRLVPEEPEFKMYLGYTTYRTLVGRDEEAAADGAQMIRQALNDGGKGDVGNVLMGRIFRDRGDEQRATRSFLKALKINPTNLDAQKELERIKKQRDGREAGHDKKEGFFSRFFGRSKDGGDKKDGS